MSWDVLRGSAVQADAQATAGKLVAMFSLGIESFLAPIQVQTVADAIVVHMMKRGVFGKAKPAPIDLGKHVIVAFERGVTERVLTLKEQAKVSPGLRFAIADKTSTWVTITPQGDAEGDPTPLDAEDVDAVRRLVDAADAALFGLTKSRRLVDLAVGPPGAMPISPSPASCRSSCSRSSRRSRARSARRAG